MYCPKLKNSIAFFETDNPAIYYVFDSALDKHFKIGEREVRWLKLCDGLNSSVQIADQLGEECSVDVFHSFIETVNRLNLLENNDFPMKKKFNLFQIKIRISNPDKWLSKHIDFVKKIMFIFKLSIIPILVMGIYFTWQQSSLLSHYLFSFQFEWSFIPFYLICFFMIMIIHEISHALMAKSYNAPVPSIGFMLFYLQPAAYVDLSGIWLLRNVKHKIMSLLAGVISQFMISSIIVILLYFIGIDNSLFWQYLVVVAFGNIFIALMNLIPFVKLDGYYILCMLLDISGLREKSREYLLCTLMKRKAQAAIDEDIRLIYIGYGILTSIYTPFVLLSGLLFIRSFLQSFGDSNMLNVIFYIICTIVIIWPLKELIVSNFKKNT